MRKGQDRKVKVARSSAAWVGRASCLGLFVLTVLATCPVVPMPAFAEEDIVDEASVPVALMDDGRVEIAFTPTEVSGELTPLTNDGVKKQLEATATVSIQNAEEYAIYLGAKTTGLVGVNSGTTIESIKSATNYDDLEANSWGIYYGEGTSVPANASYKPVEIGRGVILGSGSKVNTALTKTYALGFVANINNDVPADTYRNEITLSVVSSPLEVTGLTTLENMQDMTSAVCEMSEIGDSKQLKDVRDGKYYWVSKLGDDKCWMTQNLDLDLINGVKLTSDTSDVPAAGYTPNYTTAATATGSTINASQTGQNSWSLGDYRIANPDTSSDCGSKKNSAADCTAQFTAYTTPTAANNDEKAHYILGNHYQWNAATAGTGSEIMTGAATSSICPKGWRLPTSDGGEFDALVAALGGTSSTDNVTKAPFYGVRGGRVTQATDSLFTLAGNYGRYWSSTPHSDNTNAAYSLTFSATDDVAPSFNNVRNAGSSVRCVAR